MLGCPKSTVGAKTIGERAFSGCYTLSKVTITSSVRTIGKYAFAATTDWEDYTYTEEYEYYILNVYLVNHTLDVVPDELGMTDAEKQRVALLLYTFGNRKYRNIIACILCHPLE